MKRILLSLVLIGTVGAGALGASRAFFSDQETSTGNTFTAGAIDLQIDNESYVTSSLGVLEASPNTSWALSNLTNQLFFNFSDVKPGDIGEDTISLHVTNNDAWACMAVNITSKPDNGLVDPETDAGDVTDGVNAGELQNYLNFTFWKDDGDNVYEAGESIISSLSGAAGTIFNGAWSPIADSQNLPAFTGAITGYIAKAWCFGTLTPNIVPVAQDALGKTNPNTNGPLVRGTGFTCDGSGSQNDAQTDSIVADVSFYAVQSRNNAGFVCSSLPVLTPAPTPTFTPAPTPTPTTEPTPTP